MSGGSVNIMQENGDLTLILTTDGATPSVVSSTSHPQFGQSITSQVVCLNADAAIPTIVKTNLDWSYG